MESWCLSGDWWFDFTPTAMLMWVQIIPQLMTDPMALLDSMAHCGPTGPAAMTLVAVDSAAGRQEDSRLVDYEMEESHEEITGRRPRRGCHGVRSSCLSGRRPPSLGTRGRRAICRPAGWRALPRRHHRQSGHGRDLRGHVRLRIEFEQASAVWEERSSGRAARFRRPAPRPGFRFRAQQGLHPEFWGVEGAAHSGGVRRLDCRRGC